MSSFSTGRNMRQLKCIRVIFISMFSLEMSIAGALGKSQIRKMLVKEFLENLSIFKSADRLNLT